jgi:ribosome-binding protein aMBF1 (putative translation factor)
MQNTNFYTKTLPVAGFSTKKSKVYCLQMKGESDMIDELHTSIGRRVEARRRELGLTREGLATKTAPPMSGKYLWEIETGRKKLSADMLRRLAVALDITTDLLLGLPDGEKCAEF